MKMDSVRLIPSTPFGSAVVGLPGVLLPLYSDESPGPFMVLDLEGLGPTEMPLDKPPSNRLVNILVGIHPNWFEGQTVDDIRETLYPLLFPRYSSKIYMEILYQDVVQAQARGRIVKMEPSIFSKDPAVRITLDCDSPYLSGPNTVNPEIVTTVGTSKTTYDINYTGSAPTGFRLAFQLSSPAGSTLTLREDHYFGSTFQIVGYTWNANDRFMMDTQRGSRKALRGVNGAVPSVTLIGDIQPSFDTWLQLYPGPNRFSINSTGVILDDNSSKFTHTPNYVGV